MTLIVEYFVILDLITIPLIIIYKYNVKKYKKVPLI